MANQATEPAAPKPSWRAHPHVRRTFLAVTASFSTLVMVIGVIGFGSYFWVRAQIRTIGPASLEPAVSGATGSPIPDYTGKCARTSCNYLILGSDSRAGLTPQQQIEFGTNADIGGSNRSDTIMVLHTQPDQKKATFLSFPRDLWVNIPGIGDGKINSAFEGGIQGDGAQRVARTIREISGIQIDHILYVDLAGFEGVVNAVGGVEMCVPYPMVDPLTALDIPAGCQHFDGKTALAYVRTRHQPCDAIPDFARISRQQQFLRALLSKLLSPGELLHLSSLVQPVLHSLVVDPGLRNPAELAYLAGQLNGVNSGAADFRVVPTTTADIYPNGIYTSIVQMIQPQANDLFTAFRENKPLGDLGLTQVNTAPSPAIIKVGVFQRGAIPAPLTPSPSAAPTVSATVTPSSPAVTTSSSGPPTAPPSTAGTKVLDLLTKAGFETSAGLRSLSFRGEVPVNGSVIFFNPKAPDAQAMADVVHGYLSNLRMLPASKKLLGDLDVAVVVTPGYVIPPPPTTGQTNCP